MTMPAPPPSTTEPSAYTVGAIKPADATSATTAPTHSTNAASRYFFSARQVRCQSQQKTYASGEVTKGYLLAGKRNAEPGNHASLAANTVNEPLRSSRRAKSLVRKTLILNYLLQIARIRQGVYISRVACKV